MHRIIAGATGLIGKRLTQHWLDQGCQVTVIGRSQAHIKRLWGDKVRAVSWDQLSQDLFESAEVVVNLAGANIGEKRWSKARKQNVIDSRVQATSTLASFLAKLGRNAPPLFNASAIGTYGLQSQLSDRLPPRLTEDTEFDWQHAPDFLSTVGRRWEKAAEPAIKAGVRVVFLRFGVVLAKEGGALPQLLIPFKFYVGGRIGTGCQPFSWVAINDVVRAIDFLLAKPEVVGPINVVAPECVMQKTLANTIGAVLNKPACIPTPALAFKVLLGADMANELLLQGQNVYPQRLLDMGFHFTFSNLKSALHHILN